MPQSKNGHMGLICNTKLPHWVLSRELICSFASFEPTDFKMFCYTFVYFHSSLLSPFFGNLLCLGRWAPSVPQTIRIVVAGQFGMFISCNGRPKASVILKRVSLAFLWKFTGSVLQWRTKWPEALSASRHTQGGSRGSREAVLNDMSSVLKRWRLRRFTVWIMKCKHVPLCWPVASPWEPPTETQCLHTCLFFKGHV